MNVSEDLNENKRANSDTGVADTPIHIQKILITGYQNMTPQQKFKRVSELTIGVQQLALVRIQQQYGNIPEREQRLRLASLWIDRETMVRVFHWDPAVEGY